jgi:periplasmic protein TonB
VRGLRLPLAASVAGHAVFLLLLVWLSTRLPPLVLVPPAPPHAIAVIFAPPPVPAPPKPAAPPVVAEPPPPPPPPPKLIEPPKPPPPQVIAAPPKPPPVIRHVIAKPKPPPRRERRRRIERHTVVEPPRAPQIVAPPPQPVRAPPAPIVTSAYRSALAEWFAAHRQYPLSARERGEEGLGVLQLRVDRSGRVLSYTLVRSTGYPDLDAAIEATMRGAALPPFPADMAAQENEIAVTIPFRFHLER